MDYDLTESKSEGASAFAYPDFRSIWFANVGSNLGALIQGVGASWLMVTSGASPQMIALVQAATSLPLVLFSLVAGAVADNMDRRKVMLAAQGFLAFVGGMLAVLAWSGYVGPWLLLGFTFLIGCGTAMNGPAWQASVGDLVPRPVLPSAVAFNAMGLNLARALGPAVGGAVVAIGGAASAFLLNALSALGLMSILARWKLKPRQNPLPPERLTDAMQAGLRYVAMAPIIRTGLLRAVMFGSGASMIQALLPLVARDLLHGGPVTFGILLGSFGLGAVASAVLTKRVQATFSTNGVLRLATALSAIAALGVGASPYLWLTCAFLVLAGGGWVMAFATINVSVQLASPRWVVARSLSLYQMSVFCGVALGGWLIGFFAEHMNIATALYLAGAINLVMMALAYFVPLSPFSSEVLDPTDRWQKPETAVPVVDRSGPIVITIEHPVAAENAVEFLEVMSIRRSGKLRNGARHWTLLRDLADPEVWIERYHLPTWLDYIRHNARSTQSDQDIAERLKSLRIGESEPVVHRRIEQPIGSMPDMG